LIKSTGEKQKWSIFCSTGENLKSSVSEVFC